MAGRSDRRHQSVRARVSVLLDADRAHASWPADRRRFVGAGVRRAGLCGARPRRVAQRAAAQGERHRVDRERLRSRRAICKTLASGPRWARFGKLVTRAQRIRGYGDFLHYHLLAAGKIDVVIESDVNILDIARARGDRRGGGRAVHGSGRARARICIPARCSRPTASCTTKFCKNSCRSGFSPTCEDVGLKPDLRTDSYPATNVRPPAQAISRTATP